ncbi:MAG: DEAD/DEAH box helicase, partial [Gammaproteobacteria bacterium]
MPQREVEQAPTDQVPATDSGNRSAEALRRVVAALPGGGEGRRGQVEMVEAVAAAMAEGRHVVVRAGTGTGKTLGYLVPAILSGHRVIVATATRALQDQLATKDLPFLDEHLDHPFDWAVLKGRSNYLCAQRLAELAPAPGSSDADPADGAEQLGLDHIDGFAERADPVELARLSDWARTTFTGDRADLDHEPSEAAWAAVSTTARDCPGAHRCPRGDDCFAEAARARAADADVVVVNQHLYGLDMASDGGILPDHDVA